MAQRSDALLSALGKVFGHESFRAPQREVVEAVTLRKSDAVVIMPTGGGKTGVMLLSRIVVQ
jgi:ATP-dependent DNA helicase RecQ